MRYAEAVVCRPNMLHFLQCVSSRFVKVKALTKHIRIDLLNSCLYTVLLLNQKLDKLYILKAASHMTIKMANFARENNASEAEINLDYVFATGAFKYVYKGRYTKGRRAGQECVCKIFKSGSVFEESYFRVELDVVAKALEVVNSFNKDKVINKSIWLNKPTIWTFMPGSEREGEKNLMEPLIFNFEKFNSNTGWTPRKSSPWIDVMQALSHYSYHSSHRSLLFCDLQGGVYKDGFIITDPVIMSTAQEYGPTDLGSAGISSFFARHKCNEYCNSGWIIPHDRRQYFNVQKGTTMVLPTRQSRTPLTYKKPGL